MTDLSATLARLRDLDAKATAGPWYAVLDGDPRGQPQLMYRGLVALIERNNERALSVVAECGYVSAEAWEANCSLIAEMRNALPALITAAEGLEAAERERDDLRAKNLAAADMLERDVEDLEELREKYGSAHKRAIAAEADRDRARADLAAMTVERDAAALHAVQLSDALTIADRRIAELEGALKKASGVIECVANDDVTHFCEYCEPEDGGDEPTWGPVLAELRAALNPEGKR